MSTLSRSSGAAARVHSGKGRCVTDRFRPIHYIGNKSRILEHIEDGVDRLMADRTGAVLDLFAGSGVVSRHLARRRPVHSADVQEYSGVLTRAQTMPYAFTAGARAELLAEASRSATEILEGAVGALAELEDAAAEGDLVLAAAVMERGSIAAWSASGGYQREPEDELDRLLSEAAKALTSHPGAAILRYYGGVYFGYRQAAWLDGLARACRSLPTAARDTATAAVLGTASELTNSVGNHFAQPLRVTAADGTLKAGPLRTALKRRRREVATTFDELLVRWSSLEPARFPVRTIRGDFRDVLADLPSDARVVYADPPYTRDHYSRFYHVLETIALGDDPGLSTSTVRGVTLPSRGLYREQRHQSPFSIVSEAPTALGLMCTSLAERGVALLLSYSPVPDSSKPRDRVMTMDAVLDVVRASFTDVDVMTPDRISHSKFNAAHLNAEVTLGAEVLISART
jgi:hypothetical protein